MKQRKPRWLSKSFRAERVYPPLPEILTVCREADCPNIAGCLERGRVTFLLLGRICTRRCAFCSVEKGTPPPPDKGEGRRIAAAIEALALREVALTSVWRDDLEDGGLGQFVLVLEEIQRRFPRMPVDLLLPLFPDSALAPGQVVFHGVRSLGHDIQTVPRLYPKLRRRARYVSSLGFLYRLKEWSSGNGISSSLLLGLGETTEETIKVMKDLYSAGCDTLRLGQYLRPSGEQVPVQRYYTPCEFKYLSEIAKDLGFRDVISGPFVRSSSVEALDHGL